MLNKTVEENYREIVGDWSTFDRKCDLAGSLKFVQILRKWVFALIQNCDKFNLLHWFPQKRTQLGAGVKQAMPEDLLEEIASNSHNFLPQEKEATNKKNEYNKNISFKCTQRI